MLVGFWSVKRTSAQNLAGTSTKPTPMTANAKSNRYDAAFISWPISGQWVSGYHGDTGTRVVSETPLTAGASDAVAQIRPGVRRVGGACSVPYLHITNYLTVPCSRL
ncbi:unnamed protein product [Lota lota]